MGKATGIFLIMAGIGTAALVLPRVDTDAERQLADVVRIATGNTPPPATGPAPSPVRLGATVSTRTEQASISGRERSSRGDQGAATAPVQPAPTHKEAVVVTTPPVLVAPPQPVVRNAAPMRVDDAHARQALARDIQKELKRVGCYDGEISGEWNAATKRAMGQFISRLNAALPSDEPDHILRAMVQGYPGNACGRGMPSAIVAHSTSTKASKSADQPPSRDIATARPTVPKPAWDTSVAVAQTQPSAQSQPLSMEGRMAMGGPVAASTVTGALHTPELKAISPSAGNGISVGSAAAGVIPPPAIALPGTIAALSGVVPEPHAGLPSATTAVRSDELVAAERRARQRERERERREAATASQPFPQAYRLGATSSSKYYASESSSSRGTFTQRFFARQKSGFDIR